MRDDRRASANRAGTSGKMSRLLVLLARIASASISVSSCAYSARLASGRSTIASTTSVAPATVSASDGMQRTACDRRWRSQDASTSPASASVASAVAIRPGARSSVSALLSVRRTWCPPSANTSASAWPIRPAPTTATSVMDSPVALRDHPGRFGPWDSAESDRQARRTAPPCAPASHASLPSSPVSASTSRGLPMRAHWNTEKTT